ncbi:hypothetical protein [Spirillospora sp. NPDC029432]|uniref:hypothetical protein n=1 Tax=Spirillospora sp. NPDC029432 TaxID=3154599 RepID=UPI003451E941
MNTTAQRTGPVAAAHVLLWAQAALAALAWLLPNALVAAIVVTEGIPDDGSAPYLLIPVIFSAPLLVIAVPGLVLAASFTRGRRGVRAGIVVFEALLIGTGALTVLMGAPSVLQSVLGLLLGGGALAGAYVLAVLLRSQGRAYFTRERPAR